MGDPKKVAAAPGHDPGNFSDGSSSSLKISLRKVEPCPTLEEEGGHFFRSRNMNDPVKIIFPMLPNQSLHNLTCLLENSKLFRFSENEREMRWRELIIRKYNIPRDIQEDLMNPKIFRENGMTFREAYERLQQLRRTFYHYVGMPPKDYFSTPIIAAICLGLENKCKEILASLNLSTEYSLAYKITQLHFAIAVGDTDIIKVLVDTGKFALNLEPHYLYQACEDGSLAVVKLLLDTGEYDLEHVRDARDHHKLLFKNRINFDPIQDYFKAVITDMRPSRCTIS